MARAPSSIHTTDREPAAWKRFWADEGRSSPEVGYEKSLRDQPDIVRVQELVSNPRVRAVGLVVDKVDKTMHGMKLGTAGLHNQAVTMGGPETLPLARFARN